MAKDGLLIGQVAARAGVSRKALRLYEEAGILPAPRRTPAGYRVYDGEAIRVLEFVARARRLGFTLAEIKEIVAIRRAGRLPCPHVRAVVRQKVAELDRQLDDLSAMRRGLQTLLRAPGAPRSPGAVCPHIESRPTHANGGKSYGNEAVAVSVMRRVPGGRGRRDRRPDR
jgi:DNA-binding transcriptional MerR regulator